jgi:hypothetical protein
MAPEPAPSRLCRSRGAALDIPDVRGANIALRSKIAIAIARVDLSVRAP